MSRVILLALGLVLVAFAGCFGGGEPEEPGPGGDDQDERPDEPDDRDDPDVSVSANRTTVVMEESPDNATFGADINFTWRVDTPPGVDGSADPQNGSANASTGPREVPLNETGLAWSFTSTPENLSAYNETQVAAENVSAPGQWNATIIVERSDADNTTNETTLYVRAYAIDDNGTVYWSEEVEIRMDDVPADVWVVDVGGGTGGPFSTYDPAVLEIEAGDSVAWTNNDSVALTHTATYREGPESFDTGDIAPGATSDPIVFTVPGTYTYTCDNHATMPTATIVVSAGNETA